MLLSFFIMRTSNVWQDKCLSFHIIFFVYLFSNHITSLSYLRHQTNLKWTNKLKKKSIKFVLFWYENTWVEDWYNLNNPCSETKQSVTDSQHKSKPLKSIKNNTVNSILQKNGWHRYITLKTRKISLPTLQ